MRNTERLLLWGTLAAFWATVFLTPPGTLIIFPVGDGKYQVEPLDRPLALERVWQAIRWDENDG